MYHTYVWTDIQGEHGPSARDIAAVVCDLCIGSLYE